MVGLIVHCWLKVRIATVILTIYYYFIVITIFTITTITTVNMKTILYIYIYYTLFVHAVLVSPVAN